MAKSPAFKELVAVSIPRRWWENLVAFLFAPETDKWLGALRIGLGLLVTAYALFLGSDWHNLFASTGKGLVSRKLGEAITSFDSPLIPKLGWLVALGGYAHIGEIGRASCRERV